MSQPTVSHEFLCCRAFLSRDCQPCLPAIAFQLYIVQQFFLIVIFVLFISKRFSWTRGPLSLPIVGALASKKAPHRAKLLLMKTTKSRVKKIVEQ